MKPEYPAKTTDTLLHNVVSSTPSLNGFEHTTLVVLALIA